MILEELRSYANPKAKLSRMANQGECFRITRGLHETNKNTPGYLLAGSIYGPSYISFEYALAYYNLIPEAVYTITCATFEKKKKRLIVYCGVAMGYSSSSKWQDKIKGFNERFVIVLIRHVESYLTKVGIDMGIDEKNIYNVAVQNGQAIIANENSSVTATTNIGATANDIEQLIAAVRMKMGTLTSDEDKEAASESLEVIEAEVISEKPKKSMIKTAIASLQAIKGTVEFGSAVAALIQFVGPMLS